MLFVAWHVVYNIDNNIVTDQQVIAPISILIPRLNLNSQVLGLPSFFFLFRDGSSKTILSHNTSGISYANSTSVSSDITATVGQYRHIMNDDRVDRSNDVYLIVTIVTLAAFRIVNNFHLLLVSRP
jgi:hypothetical protein